MRIFDFIGRQFSLAVSSLSDLLDLFTGWLIRPRSKTKKRLPWWSRLLWLLLWPLGALVWLINLPFRFYRGASRQGRQDLVFGFPAVFCLFLIIAVFVHNATQSNSIQQRYRQVAEQAMAAEDYPLAKAVYTRLSAFGGFSEQVDLFNWAIVLAESGQDKRATEIMNQLAPDDRVGFPAAHRIKAASLVRMLGTSREPELSNLAWHLEHADGQDDPEMLRAWSLYYARIRRFADAANKMRSAARANPALLLPAANLYRKAGNTAEQQRLLTQAINYYTRKLDEQPDNVESLTNLSRLLFERNEFETAEKYLLDGLRHDNRPEFRELVADFYLSVCQKLLAQSRRTFQRNATPIGNQDFDRVLKSLQQALKFDPNQAKAYDVMAEFSQLARADQSQFEQLIQLFQRSIELDQSAAIAHLMMGNMLWQDGNVAKSRSHFEQAYNLDNDLSIVINNLAWSLTKSEPKDLQRALELANVVVNAQPQSASFRDTLANVYLELGEWDQALLHFQKTLQDAYPGMNLNPVHENLATIYEQLGRPEMVERHKRLAESARR